MPFLELRVLLARIQIAAFLLLISGLGPGCQETGRASASSGKSENLSEERILSLNGMLTELLFELGFGENIVGVDVTSTYPNAVDSLPNLGHITQLNAEAVLQLKPSRVFVGAREAGNPALKQLEQAGISVTSVEMTYELDNALRAARSIQQEINFPDEKILALEEKLAKDRAELARILKGKDPNDKPKVLFLYARGMGRLMVAGAETTADAMIRLAGGQNALTRFSDFQALTPESVVEAAPDVILMFSTGLASLDGKDGLSRIPGLAQTPAFRNGRIIAMDGHYLLGFGPRAGKAAIDLANQLKANPKDEG